MRYTVTLIRTTSEIVSFAVDSEDETSALAAADELIKSGGAGEVIDVQSEEFDWSSAYVDAEEEG